MMALNINSIQVNSSEPEIICENVQWSSAETSESQRKIENNLLSSIQRYEREWQDLSGISEDPALKHLRRVCTDGLLKVSKFRSICWALLLDVLRGNASVWLKKRREDRIKYDTIRKIHSLNPHTKTDIQDDPLSQSQQSIWHQHFCDKELTAVIRQDVVRTFPGIEFFRRPDIQDIMIRLLFCYAREYPDICYRQGMHEILAPILFVLHSDHQAFLHIQDLKITNEVLAEVMDPAFLEEDSYFIFSKIMSAIESYYRIHDVVPSSSGYFPVVPPTTPEDHNKSELEVVGQLNFIRDKILAKEDLHLHNHLLKLDIPLPIFGIRWLRLLFGREFPLQDLLILWDAIFAFGSNFELTNFIVVSMLIRIRKQLLVSDYTTCLTYLMKYPGSADVSLIIRHAMHMKAPHLYERPQGAFVYVSTIAQKPDLTNSKAMTLPRNKSTDTVRNGRKHTSSHDETKTTLLSLSQHQQQQQQLMKEEKIQCRINNIQTTTALATIKLAEKTSIKTEPNTGVLEGYVEDSPEVLKMQLQNAQTIMSISRLKLSQYLVTLRKYIPNTNSDELNQALDGMEELCALLKTKFNTPYTVPPPVDPAIEADEAGSQKANQRRHSNNKLSPTNSLPIQQQQQRKSLPNDKETRAAFVRQLYTEPTFEVPAVEDESIDIKPTSLATYSSSDSDSDKQENRRTRYEIPDDQISRKAAKILGSRKEVEMYEFMGSGRDRSGSIVIGDILPVPAIDPSGDREDSPND